MEYGIRLCSWQLMVYKICTHFSIEAGDIQEADGWSTLMDFHRYYKTTDPSFQAPEKYSYYHSETSGHTLAKHEMLDNILFAASLFLLIIVPKISSLESCNWTLGFQCQVKTITQFSQARVALLGNGFLLRWVRNFYCSMRIITTRGMAYSTVMHLRK